MSVLSLIDLDVKENELNAGTLSLDKTPSLLKDKGQREVVARENLGAREI
jgi:hypothetical protein